MTQQQIIKLLDLPERTLRDWKKSSNVTGKQIGRAHV